MARKPKNRPVFFKVLINEFRKKIALPPLFMEILKGRLPENPVLETEAGESWVVKIKQIGDKWFFADGWPEFVEDQELEAGNFIVFRLISDSIFKVEIFGRSCCSKSVESAARESTDDDSAEIPERRSKGPAEKSHKIGKSHFDADVHGSSSRGGGGIKIKREDGDSGEGEDVKPVGRSFVLVYKAYMKSFTSLPKGYATATGIMGLKSVTLRDQRGREWMADVRIRKTCGDRVDIGWGDFCRVNKLVEGDTCLFQFIPGGRGRGGVLLCKVTKNFKRPRGRPPGSTNKRRVL